MKRLAGPGLFAAQGVALLALGLAAFGCSRGEPQPFVAYEAPRRRPGPEDPSCEGLRRSRPEARWLEGALRLPIGAGSRLAVADASVLGGPYEGPLGLDVPEGNYALDLVVGPASGGQNRPLCARLRFGPADVASWRELGDVALDTDVLVIADEKAWQGTLGPRTTSLYAAVEADAPALESLGRDLAQKGLPLVPVLPTLGRASRPLAPGDERLVRGAITHAHARARFLVEPASPGFDVLSRLGDADYAELSFGPEARPIGVAVVAGQGSGAYAVVAGHGPGGELAALEVRLSP